MRTFRNKIAETVIVFIFALVLGFAGYAISERAKQTRCHNQCDQMSDEGLACKKMCKAKGDCPHWED